MTPITEYLVLRADSTAELESQVEARIRDGWQLQGGVSVERLPGWETPYLYQAMVHEVQR